MSETNPTSVSNPSLSAMESSFEWYRRTVGLFLGPAVFAVLLLAPFPGLTPEAARLAALVTWIVIWWVTEAIPIPVTALLGPSLAVLMGIGSVKELFAAFGDPIIFLFLGGFMIAEAMSVHGLDRRIAFAILGNRLIGSNATAVLLAFAFLSTGLSMWISNTATTAMLYPIALGVLGALSRLMIASADARFGGRPSGYRTGLLLACAYGASIGGVVTPVGSPPNLITMGQLRTLAGVHISFLQWMLLAGPLAAIMLAFAAFYLRSRFPPPVRLLSGAAEFISAERTRLGPLSRGEWNVIAVFCCAVFLWITPGVAGLMLDEDSQLLQNYQTLLPENVVAVLAACLLFILPVDWKARRATLAWSDAVRIDWGTLLLFGGGLALGGAMFKTGLAEAVGQGLVNATGADSVVSLTIVFSVLGIYLTELTSNTATATMLVPLAIAGAKAAGVDPVPPAVGCGIGCSMAFMLPVSTPPNAIIYGSGLVRIVDMVKTGFWMTVTAACFIPIVLLILTKLLKL